MEKKTIVTERKAYLAPSAKSHLIQVEENIMSFETDGIRRMEYDEEELNA